MPSFDIVCKIDKQELDNALNQARKEIAQRYDLKPTNSDITLEEKKLVVTSQTDFTLKSVLNVLQEKLVKRGISLKAFEYLWSMDFISMKNSLETVGNFFNNSRSFLVSFIIKL